MTGSPRQAAGAGTADGRPREIELKLAIPEASLAPLGEQLARHEPHGQRQHQVTIYFDTPEAHLAQRGLSLRVRTMDGQHVQTLKAAGENGVAADRGEWEWPVSRKQPDPGLLGGTPFAGSLPPGSALKPVLRTEIDRTIRILRLGGSEIEAAIDEGRIVAGDASETVRELELELKAGDPAPLYRLALELHAAAPLRVGVQSKQARGSLLRNGETPPSRKSADLALECDIRAGSACSQILLSALGHLLANQPAALRGDAEGVHQMRVAIRRLRAALVLFGPHLHAHAVSRFEAELRRVGRIFGEARDWDVFCLEILPEALTRPGLGEWRDLLGEPAEGLRKAAHGSLVAEIEAPAFTALVLGIAAWAEDGRTQFGLLGAASLDEALAELAPDLLDRLARKVARRGRHIGKRPEAELHALRKSLKKLRYGIDYLASLYPHKAVHAYLRGCKDLQQSLGAINDTVSATTLADRLSGNGRPDLAPAVGALAAHLLQRREAARDKLGKRWKAFGAAPRFWK